MSFIRENFIIGAFFIAPIAGTIWILWLIISFFDSTFGALPKKLIGFDIPGIGIITGFLFVLLSGLFARTYIAGKFQAVVESYLQKIPFVRTVYNAIKNFAELLQNSKQLGKPVAVNFGGNMIVGFKVSEVSENHMAVLIPSTPNPTTGFVFICDKESVKELDIPPEEVLKFMISLGTSPIKLEIEKKNQ